eukprot:COSAG01_NODE_2358_length_7838_cov_7.568807_6_plen_97_part_00
MQSCRVAKAWPRPRPTPAPREAAAPSPGISAGSTGSAGSAGCCCPNLIVGKTSPGAAVEKHRCGRGDRPVEQIAGCGMVDYPRTVGSHGRVAQRAA